MNIIVLRLLLSFAIWLNAVAVAQYLRDEDVHLKIYSPPSDADTGTSAIALELVIYNRDEEFFVSILSEEGSTICKGQFSRFSADRVKCSYDTSILRDGDNSFHVTIRSVATGEIVLDTVSHFFYDAHRVIPASVSENMIEYWDVLITLFLLFLLFRYGRSTYTSIKNMIYDPSSGAAPPPPPSLPVPSYEYLPPPALVVSPSQGSSQPNIQINIRGSLLWKAALIGAAALLGGKVMFGPRRNHAVMQQRALPQTTHDSAMQQATQFQAQQLGSTELYAAYASGAAEFATLGASTPRSSYNKHQEYSPGVVHVAYEGDILPRGRSRRFGLGGRTVGQLRKV